MTKNPKPVHKKVQNWWTKSWPEWWEFSGGWRACSINIPSLADRWMDPWGETWRRACEKSFRRLNLKLFSFRLFSDIEILKKVKLIPDTWSMIGMLEMEMFKSWIFPVNRASAQFKTFPFHHFVWSSYLWGWKLNLNLNQTETRNLMLMPVAVLREAVIDSIQELSIQKIPYFGGDQGDQGDQGNIKICFVEDTCVGQRMWCVSGQGKDVRHPSWKGPSKQCIQNLNLNFRSKQLEQLSCHRAIKHVAITCQVIPTAANTLSTATNTLSTAAICC